jgi:hypothetical protein
MPDSAAALLAPSDLKRANLNKGMRPGIETMIQSPNASNQEATA